MEKSFENRKVKFFIIERKEVKKPKIVINEARNYDDFDLSQEMWLQLSNRASDDMGIASREKPKVPISSNKISHEKTSYTRREMKDIIRDVKEEQKKPVVTQKYIIYTDKDKELVAEAQRRKDSKNKKQETILAVKIEEKELSANNRARKQKHDVTVKTNSNKR